MSPDPIAPDPIDAWSRDLAREVVTPLAADHAAAIAVAVSIGGVAATGGAAGPAVTAVASHTAAKVVAAIALTTVIGGGIAAVTGNLPDPIQSWVADVADTIGIDLPRPEDALPSGIPPTIPSEVTVPPVTLPDVTLPDVTLP
jgi:hypothetical protein